MHGIPHHENEHAPCNLYCAGEVHHDVMYLAPWFIAQAGADLLGYVCATWHRLAYDRTSTILALREAPEAKGAPEHYPHSYQTRPMSTLPYRVTYWVLTRGNVPMPLP